MSHSLSLSHYPPFGKRSVCVCANQEQRGCSRAPRRIWLHTSNSLHRYTSSCLQKSCGRLQSSRFLLMMLTVLLFHMAHVLPHYQPPATTGRTAPKQQGNACVSAALRTWTEVKRQTGALFHLKLKASLATVLLTPLFPHYG